MGHEFSPRLQLGRSEALIKYKDRAAEPSFYWQDGYGAFSVGARELETVTSYIANQEAHHASESFQDELLAICAETNTTYDERFMWD